MKTGETSSNLLIVDDAPDNLRLLVDLLSRHSYQVRPVTSGEAALRAVRARCPDLVLLDVTMLGMDGYEVCRRLKVNPRTRDVPVIFLSAVEDTAGKIAAFRAGGVDYVTKPFQPEEVLARVSLHLELSRNRAALARSYQQLHELERARDAFIHMVAHDLRSPLWAVEVALTSVCAALGGRDANVRRLLTDARTSARTALDMVTTMLELSRLQQGRLPVRREPVEVVALVRAVVAGMTPMAGRRTLAVSGDADAKVSADVALLRRVVENLLSNAIKFTEDGGRVEFDVRVTGEGVTVACRDDGIGLRPEDQENIFTSFMPEPSAEPGRGFGIGLALVQAAVAAHGGRVTLRSRPGEGSTFSFTIPPEREPGPPAVTVQSLP
jgi:two-component system, sensor histidine kinase and response regulator